MRDAIELALVESTLVREGSLRLGPYDQGDGSSGRGAVLPPGPILDIQAVPSRPLDEKGVGFRGKWVEKRHRPNDDVLRSQTHSAPWQS